MEPIYQIFLHLSLFDTRPDYHAKVAPIGLPEKREGGIPISKKNVTNRLMAAVSLVMSHWGKPELEICNRKKRGLV